MVFSLWGAVVCRGNDEGHVFHFEAPYRHVATLSSLVGGLTDPFTVRNVLQDRAEGWTRANERNPLMKVIGVTGQMDFVENIQILIKKGNVLSKELTKKMVAEAERLHVQRLCVLVCIWGELTPFAVCDPIFIPLLLLSISGSLSLTHTHAVIRMKMLLLQ